MASKAQLELAPKKLRKSSSAVKQKKNITKPASTSSRVRKNSSKTPNVSTSKEKKAKSGFLQWTPARRHSFIVSVLRTGTRRWPPKFETLAEAKTEKKTNVATGRVAQHYRCALCSNDFPATGVQVDHVKPVVSADGFTTWDAYIDGMFCEKSNLQVLCLACHKVKTLEEKGERKKNSS